MPKWQWRRGSAIVAVGAACWHHGAHQCETIQHEACALTRQKSARRADDIAWMAGIETTHVPSARACACAAAPRPAAASALPDAGLMLTLTLAPAAAPAKRGITRDYTPFLLILQGIALQLQGFALPPF